MKSGSSTLIIDMTALVKYEFSALLITDLFTYYQYFNPKFVVVDHNRQHSQQEGLWSGDFFSLSLANCLYTDRIWPTAVSSPSG
jgi:hypothetical protein